MQRPLHSTSNIVTHHRRWSTRRFRTWLTFADDSRLPSAFRSNMGGNPPSIVAWASIAELDQLKSWFYDPQDSLVPGEPFIDLRQRAIQRVHAQKRLTSGTSLSNARNPNTSRDSLYNSLDTSSPSSADAASRVPYKYDTRVDPLRQ
jgi:hypothetical protein